MPLQNPYNLTQSTGHRVWAIVSPDDYAFLKKILTCTSGRADIVLSTLFKAYIDELRNLESENGQPFEPGWCTGHPTLLIAERVLERLTTRFSSGPSSGPTPARPTRRVRKKDGSDAAVGADSKGSVGKGGNKPRSKAKADEKG